MNIPESILSNLTDEQKKKMEAAQSPEEISTLAKQFGTELSLEQLEGVSGGNFVVTGERGESLNPTHKASHQGIN